MHMNAKFELGNTNTKNWSNTSRINNGSITFERWWIVGDAVRYDGKKIRTKRKYS